MSFAKNRRLFVSIGMVEDSLKGRGDSRRQTEQGWFKGPHCEVINVADVCGTRASECGILHPKFEAKSTLPKIIVFILVSKPDGHRVAAWEQWDAVNFTL